MYRRSLPDPVRIFVRSLLSIVPHSLFTFNPGRQSKADWWKTPHGIAMWFQRLWLSVLLFVVVCPAQQPNPKPKSSAQVPSLGFNSKR